MGCMEPHVRYTRDDQGKVHLWVPANWDYRRQYVVPPVRLKTIADTYLGIRYKNGGTGKKGVDCSGFVFLVYQELTGAAIPRSSSKLWKMGDDVSNADARPGDLVFFRGGFFNGINHVGIYMGNNTFIHASAKSGVMYDTLDEAYYKKRFAGIRRIL
jgi:lipoprotein Spr